VTLWFLGADAALDLTRLIDFLIEQLHDEAYNTVDIVPNALKILLRHPKIGWPVKLGLRELVIFRGASGYLALHQYDEAQDPALVLRLRHQRESGYPQPSKSSQPHQMPRNLQLHLRWRRTAQSRACIERAAQA
jgi:hypothetical protein